MPEYHRPILPGQQPRLVTGHQGDQVGIWLLDGNSRLASARPTLPGNAPTVPGTAPVPIQPAVRDQRG
jgi:hypothetical protein